jgi:hypothetical protein
MRRLESSEDYAATSTSVRAVKTPSLLDRSSSPECTDSTRMVPASTRSIYLLQFHRLPVKAVDVIDDVKRDLQATSADWLRF